MDFEHDELVPYTPIAGAICRRKMSEHGHLRMMSSRNEHPLCSLSITLLVGGIHKRENFPKRWRVCQIQRYTMERAWNSLLIFVVRELVFLLSLKKLLSVIVWGYV